MRSYLECIPCFMSQALRAARIAQLDDEQTLKLLRIVGGKIKDIQLSDPPPKTGKMIYSLVAEISGKRDPYEEVKREHIEFALKMLPFMEGYIRDAPDPVDAAMRVAAAGNIIDLGARKTVENVQKVLEDALTLKHRRWDIDQLKSVLADAGKILVLGDNAGETVFDFAMMKTLRRVYPEAEIFFSVRGGPTINDATYEDAVRSRIDEVATIISTGSDAPGILMDEVSAEFLEIFNSADVVISKGQGNYETLNDAPRPIFFVMTVKCEVVARHLNLPEGSSVLYFHPGGNPSERMTD
ncbi:MAG TPA: DUF89 family protein [candidate division Zixibacteria bacterium]|nr:DUF89 family protein [candidate division Zixibacteria bacterium]